MDPYHKGILVGMFITSLVWLVVWGYIKAVKRDREKKQLKMFA